MPPGPLAAGQYVQRCTWPNFSLDVPEGFAVVAQQPDWFGMLDPAGDPRDPSAFSLARPSESTVIQRVASLAHYDVSEVTTTEVGGVAGQSILVRYVGPDDPAGEYLFALDDDTDARTVLQTGGIARLIELEVNGVTVVILAATTVDEARSFFEITDAIVASLEFIASDGPDPRACPPRPAMP